jgi:RNA 3'-terminal phosphate cyclase
MGPKVKLELQRYGFYPAGGGRFVVELRSLQAGY